MDHLAIIEQQGYYQTRAGSPKCLVPGSFNPFHDGHLAMAEYARQTIGGDLFFELSLTNVDKPAVSEQELRHRMEQDFGDFGLMLTRAPRFQQKARLFPGVQFGVGADTILRFSDLRYHQNSRIQFQTVVRELNDLGCRFLVFPRKMGKNTFCEANIGLPEELLQICDFVPTDSFLWNISSTDLRSQREQN